MVLLTRRLRAVSGHPSLHQRIQYQWRGVRGHLSAFPRRVLENGGVLETWRAEQSNNLQLREMAEQLGIQNRSLFQRFHLQGNHLTSARFVGSAISQLGLILHQGLPRRSQLCSRRKQVLQERDQEPLLLLR